MGSSFGQRQSAAGTLPRNNGALFHKVNATDPGLRGTVHAAYVRCAAREPAAASVLKVAAPTSSSIGRGRETSAGSMSATPALTTLLMLSRGSEQLARQHGGSAVTLHRSRS